MLQFFRTLWGGTFPAAGNLTLSFHSPGHKNVACRHVPFDVLSGLGQTDLDELDAINAGKTSGFSVPQEIYFGLSSRDDNLETSQQGLKSHCWALPAFAVDIDILDPTAHKAASLPASRAEALSLLEGEPEPSLVVDSGHGLQIYWVLKTPIKLQGEGAVDRTAVEASYQRFWQRFQTRAAAKGWKIDRTSTVERIWRVPGCVNHKVPAAPKPVVLLGSSGKTYEISDLDTGVVLPVAPSAPAPPSRVSGAAPYVPPAFTATVADVIRRLKRKGDGDTAELRRKILAGEILATEDRDAAFNRACNVLVWHAPDADPELLVGMLRPSLLEWATAPGATKTLDEEIEKAHDKISRARADWIGKKAAIEAATDRAYLNMWKVFSIDSNGRQLPDSGTPSPEGPGASTGAVSPAGSTSDLHGAPGPSGAGVSAATSATHEKHLVIMHKTALYAYDAGINQYSQQHTKDEIAIVMREALKGTKVEFYYENEKGKMVKKKLSDLLDRYCTVADNLVYSMFLQQSAFHIQSSTFFEAVCPLVPLTPLFDQDIDTWMRLLGHSNPDKLLDWVAVSTMLDSPACAIYLEGVKGVGKGLFAAGLAKQWGGAPTNLESVVGNFNSDLARNPFVLMDEAMPRGFGSAELRSMISTSTRELKRKFLPNCDMRGCIRLVIAANNADVLASIGEEATTQADLEATVERIAHIVASPDSAVYLASLGGLATTRSWVDDNRIARHALWLRDNRVVVPGKRFLVQGTPTDMLRRLVSNGTMQNLVLEWITRYLLNPEKLVSWCKPSTTPVRIHAGEGKIYINGQIIADAWTAYMRDDTRVPTINKIGRILASFSTDRVRIPERNGHHYHVINPTIVTGWADENQLGTPEALAKSLNKPLVLPAEPE